MITTFLQRQCRGCLKFKLISSFSKDRCGKDGVKSRCRDCLTIAKRVARHKNPLPNRAACKRYAEKNPEKTRKHAAAYRERVRLSPVLRMRKRAAYARWAAANPKKKIEQGRKAYLKRYGLSIEAYDVLFTVQDGLCAVCKKPSTTRLAVDHCHKTGKIRGLLCFHCNSSLGHLFESVEILNSAIAYLERSGQEPT